MKLSTAVFLTSEQGRRLLDEAAAGGDALGRVSALRKKLPPEIASAVSLQVDLRRRAAARFTRAGGMLFTPEALEQATAEPVAGFRSESFKGFETVADLTCGIGADTIGLASSVRVSASDRDPVRLTFARHNAAVYGVEERITFSRAVVEDFRGGADAVFIDPSRRSKGRRHTGLENSEPSWKEIKPLFAYTDSMMIKCSPLFDFDSFEDGREWSFDVVELGGEVRELDLRFGALKLAAARAVVLPGRAVLEGKNVECAVGDIKRYIYDPASSVVRAHLVAELAEVLDAHLVDEKIAYLTSDRLVRTPFAQAFEVEDVLPMDERKLRKHLSARGIGTLEIKVRGAGVTPEALRKRLKPSGDGAATLIATRRGNRRVAVLARRIQG